MSGKNGHSGWGTLVGLIVATSVLSSLNPILLFVVPLALLLIGLPRGRYSFMALGAAAALSLLLMPPAETFGYVARGWALVLGACFVAIVAVRPAATFLPRGLLAVVASLAAAGTTLVLFHRWRELDWAMGRRLQSGTAELTAMLGARTDSWPAEMSEMMYQVAEVQTQLYPSLLALGSLAALAVAWWGYQRLLAPDRTALRPLPEFRFADHLIWLMVGGLVLLALPLGDAAWRTGTNVVTFMGALYALRGVAVVLALAGPPGLLGTFLGGLLVLFAVPVVIAATLVVGLSDTWLDLRTRGVDEGAVGK